MGRDWGGAGFKDVMGWGSVHLFGLCIMWHTSITETAQGLQSLIRRRSVEPAGCRFAWFFWLFFFLPAGCEAGLAEGVSEGRVVGATIGGGGWMGGMWLETTAGCPLTGKDAVAGAVVGGAHMSPWEADIIFFVSTHVDNGFCPRPLPRCDLIHYTPTYVHPGILNWLACRILSY